MNDDLLTMQSPWLTRSSQAASFQPNRGAKATTVKVIKNYILGHYIHDIYEATNAKDLSLS